MIGGNEKSMIVQKWSSLTDIKFEKNKRNFRDQSQHVKMMNLIRDMDDPDAIWRNKEGRPKGSGTKKKLVQDYAKENPNASVDMLPIK